MRKVLVTGAGGFCALHLANHLAMEDDCEIFGIGIRKLQIANNPYSHYLCVDICDYEQVRKAIREIQPDTIFHLAGLTRGSNVDIYNVNFMGGVHLLDSVHEIVPNAQMLVVGTAAEYGFVDESSMPVTEDQPCSPNNPYGLSKYALTLAAQNYAVEFGVKVIIARPFNIVGGGIPTTLVVGAVIQRAKQALLMESDPVISVGNLDAERDFISVEDAVKGYLGCLNSEKWGEVFNICSGEPRSIRSIVELLLSFSERKIGIKIDPKLVGNSKVKIAYGSYEKAQRNFGFEPNRDLDECLMKTWNYAIKNSSN